MLYVFTAIMEFPITVTTPARVLRTQCGVNLNATLHIPSRMAFLENFACLLCMHTASTIHFFIATNSAGDAEDDTVSSQNEDCIYLRPSNIRQLLSNIGDSVVYN